MSRERLHTFHIPVMGLAFTIDTPVKVARFGISSVVSIIQDDLVEKMRNYYCRREGMDSKPITNADPDYRAERIRSYLNLLNAIVQKQVEKMKEEEFKEGNDITRYFEMLPENPLKMLYREMIRLEKGAAREFMEKQLRSKIQAGAIDVNIMTKLDRSNYSPGGELLPAEYSDALSALRGFATSELDSSVVFSAGFNPRLYSYCSRFEDFFPGEKGRLKKKIILKVSDFRSALTQGKFLAKKGLWVSEFRIESGLNCGGHVFPTEGYLMGPILEEFKTKRRELYRELLDICHPVWLQRNNNGELPEPGQKVTVQGGVGTASELEFLLEYYKLDSVGIGSPFLLVPEATNVDDETLAALCTATKDDYFLSEASPLGAPFHNFRKSSSEKQRLGRIKKGRPGSPCYKKYLAFNTEFTKQPICVASREYQHKKLEAIESEKLSASEKEKLGESLLAKDCLCEGLATPALLKNQIAVDHGLSAVVICPGPNLAYFSGIFSLAQMVDHFYGRTSLLNALKRPHMFINELSLYFDYLGKELTKGSDEKRAVYLDSFRQNLLKGIEYYRGILPKIKMRLNSCAEKFNGQLDYFESMLNGLIIIPLAKPV